MHPVEQVFWLVVVLPLAIGAIVDVWRNGSLFAGCRAFVEGMAAAYERGDRAPLTFLAALLDCSFCLSVHVPAWLLLLQFLPALGLSQLGWVTAGRLWLLPSYSLAAFRLSWLLNGLVPDHVRYGYRLNKGRDDYRPDAD